MRAIVDHIDLARRLLAAWAVAGLAAPALATDTGASERLAQRGIEPSAERLVQFAAQGDSPVVELLLAAGLNARSAEPRHEVTALHNAAAQGHVRLIALLLDRGADVNAADRYGNTALIDAAYFGQLQAVKALLARGANVAAVSGNGQTALSAAVYSGKDALVAVLLAHEGAADLPLSALEAAAVAAGRAQRTTAADMIRTRIDHNANAKP